MSLRDFAAEAIADDPWYPANQEEIRTKNPAEIALIALAPELAVLCADMADTIRRLREHTRPAPAIGEAYVGWHETYWSLMGELDALLVRFRELEARPDRKQP